MIYDLTYQRAEGPSGSPRSGTKALTSYILGEWDARSMGIYNPRRIRGISMRWSIHAEGRAVDIGVATTPKGLLIGNQIAEWVISQAPFIGVQYLIWNRRSWNPKRGWKTYRGVNPHKDHLHIEQTRAAADALTLNDIDRLAIPFGIQGPTTPEYEPPIVIQEPIISIATRPQGGAWALGESGSVYAFDAPYYGGPNDEQRPINYEVLGTPARIEFDGLGYAVTTDLGYVYNYWG